MTTMRIVQKLINNTLIHLPGFLLDSHWVFNVISTLHHLKNKMKCELGGLFFSSDWTCPRLTIENAYVTRRNPPYSRNTNYTVKCNSGLVLLNDATSTSYKITCDQDLNWVGNTSTWPQCVESKYLQKEGTFPLLEYHFTSAFYCDKNDLPALSAHKTRIRTLPVHEICEYTEPRPYLISCEL